MANMNVSRINGFRPKYYKNGTPWTGAVTRYVSLAASTGPIYIGAIVALNGAADANGIPEVVQLTNAVSGPACGVAVGIGFNPNNLNVDGQFRPSGAQTADRFIYVVDDPNVVFEAQSDGAQDANDIGYGISALLTVNPSGSTTTGQSLMQVDASEVIALATSTDRLLRIVGFDRVGIDNTLDESFNKVLVMFNATKHSFGGGGGVVL